MIAGFSDSDFNGELLEIAMEYDRGGEAYQRKLHQYKQRKGLKIGRGFTSSPEFRRLQKSKRQKERRLEKRFAKGRADLVAMGDLSLVKNYTLRHEGPFWMIGKELALAVWDEYSGLDLDRYGMTIREDQSPRSRVYLTRLRFDLALAKMGRDANKMQEVSERPIYKVIEADDGFNAYIIQQMIE